MRKRYHFARQRAQLIHFSKQLTALREAGRTISDEQLSRFRRMVRALAPRLGFNKLRRSLGTGALLLGVAFGVQAQSVPNFMEPEVLPFGIIAADRSPYVRPLFADIDEDGDLDFFYGSYGEGNNYASSFIYQENIGSATEPVFAAAVYNPFGLSPSTSFLSVDFVDLDGDGDLDIFESGFNYNVPELGVDGDHIILYRENIGSATTPAFSPPQANPWNLETGNEDDTAVLSLFGDLDGDGDLDIISFLINGDDTADSKSIIYENTTPEGGEISFSTPIVSPFDFGDADNGIIIPDVLADLDNDGDLDLFGSVYGVDADLEEYSFPTFFMENIGSVTEADFDTAQVGENFGISEFIAEYYIVRCTMADLDGDGDLDLLVSSDTEGFVYYRNGFPTGTNEQRVDIDLKVMPNPTSGRVTIATDRALSRIEIYDGLARRVQSLVGSARNIDLSTLPAGTYTAKLILPAGNFATARIVKR